MVPVGGELGISTYLIAGLAWGEGLDQHVVEKAKTRVAMLILPDRITHGVVEKYYRRSLLNRSWRALAPQARALILALRKTLRAWGQIRSAKLKQTVKQILLTIELAGLRGRALLYGILIAMKNTIQPTEGLLEDPHSLLALGISYLNRPQTYRFYG